MKPCSLCREIKPLDAFGVASRARDGRQSRCRACRSMEGMKNRDRETARHAAWRERNADHVAAYQREWHSTSEAARESRWRGGYRARARQHGHPIVIGEGDQEVTVKGVIARYGDRCAYGYPDICLVAFSQLDHHTPVQVGGPHTLDNVRPSCRPCNLSRWSRGLRWVDPDTEGSAA